MPMKIKTTAGGKVYGSPMVGPVNHTLGVLVDISTLTAAASAGAAGDIDQNGYLRPGVVLDRAGARVLATVPVFCVVIEPTPVTNPGEAVGTAPDVIVACAVIGVVNRDIAEDNLGRAYTAAEIAGFDLAGSKLVLSNT